jgi:FkbM family methyltransferase
VANLTWFDIAIEPDHWPMEFLQNGAIGAGRSSQFQSWDIEELDGTIYLVLSNKIDVKRFRCDQSSGGSLKFVCKNDGTTLRHLVPAGGAYLLPYFTAAIPHAKIRTIVEIGCADGADSIALQRYYEADVFAFECHPDYARFCRLKVAGNKRVRFYETGISEQTSDAHDFYVSDGKNPAASSFFIANPRYPYESYEQRPIKVATTTLDEWSLDAGVECIDLLCMDCQGSTLAALRGGTDILSRTQFILAQLGTRPIYQNEPLAAEIVKMLSERGFQLIRSLNQWGVTNSGTFCNHPNYDRRYQHLESWFGGFLFKGMSDGERSLAREIISQRYFLYKRVGYDQRLIELLPDGRIGVGAAEFELNWMVQDQADGDTHLLILGLNHVTCRLVQKSPGLFIGRWLLYEQMPIELVNAAGPNNAPVRLPLDVGYAQGQFSQQGEDNTLLFILAQIKGSINRTFVEIGVGPRYGFDPNNCDLECNCWALRERGWRGWMFDRNQYPDDCEVIQEHFSAANAVEIFERHKIPEQIDVLSIDIDGQDYWVWRALGARARIVCIEYNCSIGGLQVVPEMPDFSWDGTNYYGASLDAMNALGKQLGYVLIYTNNVNAFFIQRKLISNPDEFRETTAAPVVPLHPVDSSGRPWLNPNTL